MSTEPAANHDSATTATAAHHDTAHAAGAHGATAEASDKFTFNKLLDKLGDHHELDIFFGKFEILPVVLVDQYNSLHVYPNLHAMEETGSIQCTIRQLLTI